MTDPGFIVRQEEPFNGGPAPERMASAFITSNALFYVRNHGNVPEVDRASYRLKVGGEVRRPLELTLDDLGRLPRASVTATLQCAGNRRRELIRVRPIPGELPWDAEAISNAVWSGTPLAEVLAAAQPAAAARHVALRGLDETERHGTRFCFGGSIPLDKAMGREVLLADRMNGEPLPPLHGAPLRLVVPGYVGARSVKWLAAITLQHEPSDNYFQAKAYRLFPAGVRPGAAGPGGDFDWNRGMMLGESSLNAVITTPAAPENAAAPEKVETPEAPGPPPCSMTTGGRRHGRARGPCPSLRSWRRGR